MRGQDLTARELRQELHRRQRLLEHLSAVQASIIAQRALPEILDQIVQAARELVAADVAVLHLHDRTAPGRTTVAASAGASHALLTSAQGVGPAGRDDWLDHGMSCWVSTLVLDGDSPGGDLGVAFADPDHAVTSSDQAALAALAEQVSLAVGHAQALDDAESDGLTGLPNRSIFMARLERALTLAGTEGREVAVILVDLDDFQTLNDSLGHQAGDEILIAAARLLSSELRAGETLARPGGDEFAILVENSGHDLAIGRAREILAAVTAPVRVVGREVRLGASIGLVVSSGDLHRTLRDAGVAMHQAKAAGGSAVRIFEPQMHADAVERLELNIDLSRAVINHELELHYQPIFAMRSGEIAGLEALVRWRHPSRGLIAPDQFVPMAEASGRIHELGEWVLRQACHQAALWRAKYPGVPSMQVGVNLSAAQLDDEALVRNVRMALDAARLDIGGITLEVTESAVMADLEAASRRLRELRDLGIEVAIDDFGIGHSSLRYLKLLPLDNVKIAQPFIEEIGNPDSEPPILRAILDLSAAFGLRPIAEGIERDDQAGALLALGCELGQGHALSRPLPAAQADDLILRVGLLGGPTPDPRESADEPRLRRSESSDAER